MPGGKDGNPVGGIGRRGHRACAGELEEGEEEALEGPGVGTIAIALSGVEGGRAQGGNGKA